MRSVWVEESWLSALRGPMGRLRVGRVPRRALKLPDGAWVRVANRLAGVDEGDLALARGGAREFASHAMPRPHRRYLGREVVGIVTEVGAEVSLVRVGDRVVLQTEPQASCLTLGLQPPCRACAVANVALCEHRALPWVGVGAGWSEEMVVHEGQLFLVPTQLGDEQALLLEPASRALRGVAQRLPDPGALVLVLGGGALGQIAIEAIQALAPGAHVTLATGEAYQERLATQRGAEAVLPARRDLLLARGAEHTNAQSFVRGGQRYILGGFDVVFDCLGSRDSLDVALRLARSGGAVVVIAPPARAGRLDIAPVWHDEVTISGITGPGAESLPQDMSESIGARTSTLALAARLFRKNRLHLEGIVTHRLPARQVRRALAIAANPARHEALRVALTFEAESH